MNILSQGKAGQVDTWSWIISRRSLGRRSGNIDDETSEEQPIEIIPVSISSDPTASDSAAPTTFNVSSLAILWTGILTVKLMAPRRRFN